MLGTIIGDVIGSRFELNNTKNYDFDLFTNDSMFTDDTILTIAISNALVYQNDYAQKLKEYGLKYPNAGYGMMFKNWLYDRQGLKGNSFGNGSAMRISPFAFAFDNIETVLKEVEVSCLSTHNNIDAIIGAKAIASCIFLARKNKSKLFIKEYVEKNFNYNLNFSLNSIRETYHFDSSCKGSVPQSIVAFLESENFVNAIRLAISLGGDSDTIAAMTGSIAEAFYKFIPEDILCNSLDKLTLDLRFDILKFLIKYPHILSEKNILYFESTTGEAELIINNGHKDFEVVNKSLIGILDEEGKKLIYNDGTIKISEEPYNNKNYEEFAVLVKRKLDSKLFSVVCGEGYIEGTSFCWPPFELNKPLFIEFSQKLFNSFFSSEVKII